MKKQWPTVFCISSLSIMLCLVLPIFLQGMMESSSLCKLVHRRGLVCHSKGREIIHYVVVYCDKKIYWIINANSKVETFETWSLVMLNIMQIVPAEYTCSQFMHLTQCISAVTSHLWEFYISYKFPVPTLLSSGYHGLLSWGKSGRGVKLITHLHLVLRWRMPFHTFYTFLY